MTVGIELTPTSVNYVSPYLQFNQLTYNTQVTKLSTNVTASTVPSVQLDGAGRAYLKGVVTISGGSTDQGVLLLTLPAALVPQHDFRFVVPVLRAGALVSNAVKLSAGGAAISSVTVTAPGSSTTIPTVSTTGPGDEAVLVVSAMKAVSDAVATPQSSTGSYAPGDHITLTGGTFTTATVLNVTNTLVESATVAAGGSGGTNGTQTVTGTTGTGTKFQASVTVSGGAITAVLSISLPGNYTLNPTSLTTEPVTGAGLTGAELSLKMGVLTAPILTAGSYSVLPSNPVSQGSTTGSGTGFTATMAWGVLSVGVTDGGTGFTPASGISFSTGGATATINLGTSTTGALTLITAPQANDVVYLDPVQFLVNSYYVTTV